MLSVLIQSWWLWAVLFGITFFIITFPPTVQMLFDKRWHKGPWSFGVFLFIMLTCMFSYLVLNISSVYIYTQPMENLQVIAPTPAPTPPQPESNDEGGMWSSGFEPIRNEDMAAGMINGGSLILVIFQPIIPFALIGLFLFIVFAIFIRLVKEKVSAEQRKHRRQR